MAKDILFAGRYYSIILTILLSSILAFGFLGTYQASAQVWPQLGHDPSQLDLSPMTIDQTNSRIGIGTTSPDSELHVEGTVIERLGDVSLNDAVDMFGGKKATVSGWNSCSDGALSDGQAGTYCLGNNGATAIWSTYGYQLRGTAYLSIGGHWWPTDIINGGTDDNIGFDIDYWDDGDGIWRSAGAFVGQGIHRLQAPAGIVSNDATQVRLTVTDDRSGEARIAEVHLFTSSIAGQWIQEVSLARKAYYSKLAVGSNTMLDATADLAVDGDVGVGTPAPSSKLEVSDANTPRITLTDTTTPTSLQLITADTSGIIRTATSHDLALGTGGNNHVTIDTSGSVGIGTNTPLSGFKLDVDGPAMVQGHSFYLRNPTSPVGDQTFGMVVNTVTGRLTIGRADDTPTPGTLQGNQDLVITQSGNVGIGTNSPSAGLTLDVEGNVGATQYCDQNGANCRAITAMGGDTDWTEAGGNVYRDTGNVGIGTTSPQRQLHIDASSGIMRLEGDGGYWDFHADNTVSLFRIFEGTDERFAIRSGNVGIGTNNPSETLDVEGNLQMNLNAIKDAYMFTGDAFGYDGKTIVGSIYNKFIRADQKYTVTADKALSGGSIANIFDGNGGSSANWVDADLPVTINIDLGGMRHYFEGVALEFQYLRSVSGVKIEKFYDPSSADGWSCGDAVWSDVYDTTTNTESTIMVRNNIGNGICQFRITLSGTSAYANDIRLSEIGAWQFYYGQEGAFVRVTGDKMYGNLAIKDTSPQIFFEDSNDDDYWIHVNSDRMYFLWDELDDGDWDSPHPLYFQGRDSYFGGVVRTTGGIRFNDGSLQTRAAGSNVGCYEIGLPAAGTTLCPSGTYMNGVSNCNADGCGLGILSIWCCPV